MIKEETKDWFLKLYGDLPHYKTAFPTEVFIPFKKEYFNNPIEEDLELIFSTLSVEKNFEILGIAMDSSTMDLTKVLYKNKD
jgi:hypothetical protein